MHSSRLFSVSDVARALRKGEFGIAARIGRKVCSNTFKGVAPGTLSVRDAARAVRKGEFGLALRIGHDLTSEAAHTATDYVRQQSRSVLRRLGRTS
jgi:acetyl-CoA acetyltransferase